MPWWLCVRSIYCVVLGGEGVDDAGGHGEAKAAGDEGGGAESDLTVELLGPAVGGGGRS